MNSHLIICQLQKKIFDIKKEYFNGGFPADIYEVIMSIQSAFFLSHKIREYVDFFLFFLDENLIIQFEGNKLRYLGPDERSIGMLLMKVLSKKDQIKFHQKKRSTPGIWIIKKKFEDFFSAFSENWEKIIPDSDLSCELEISERKNVILLIPGHDCEEYLSKNIAAFPHLKMGVCDIPQKMRSYLTILKFYSYYDTFGGK